MSRIFLQLFVTRYDDFSNNTLSMKSLRLCFFVFVVLFTLFGRTTTQTTIGSTTDDTTSSTNGDPTSSIDISSTTSEDTTTTTVKTTTTTITTTTTLPPTTTPVPNSLDSHSFMWDKSDPSFTSEIVLTAAKGCVILVTLEHFSLTGGDYVLITTDDTAAYGRAFTGTIKNGTKYLFELNVAIVKYVIDPDNTEQGSDSFVIVFERLGEPLTTPSTEPSSTISLPTTEQDDEVYITVSVAGHRLTDYLEDEVVNKFKNCVLNMARLYLQLEDITLTSDISIHNVIIAKIDQCPSTWPNYETCVNIQFKLPIFHDESKWNGYQMNTQHLSNMWNKYSDSCSAFQPYEDPDIDNIVMWWAIGISLVTAAFILLLWFLKRSSVRLRGIIERQHRNRSRRRSDTMSIISSSRSYRDSKLSLEPHPLQDTPKFFD